MIGAEETVRVRYRHDAPDVESERRETHARKRPQAKSTPGRAVGRRLQKSKREDRERRQRSIRRRRVLYGVLAASLVVGIAWGLFRLTRSEVFSLDEITVEGTSHHTTASIVRLAGLESKRHVTLLNVSTGRIATQLEQDPWIEDSEVSRSFPHRLVITVKERRPVAVIDGGGDRLWVAAEDGWWLSKRSSEDTGLVLVRDIARFNPVPGKQATELEVRNAIDVIVSISPELRSRVEMVSAPSVDETALHTTDGIEIFVGEAVRMAEKDRLIREILTMQKDAVVYINVRVVNRPTWRGLK